MANERVALVTGASRGIGLETARQLVMRGWKVGITARGEADLDIAAATLGHENVEAVSCDVTDRASVEAAVTRIERRFGGIRALINNAGIIDPVGRLLDVDPAEWMRLLQVNIGGVLLVTRAVLPGMLARGHGVIINLSSGAAQNAVDGWGAYCSSKAGLAMLTQSLALEYGAQGIRVHDFVPGVVSTRLLNGAQQKFDNPVARLNDEVKLPAEVPARCLAWLVDEGDGRNLAVQQSIRDAGLRRMVGLEERATW